MLITYVDDVLYSTEFPSDMKKLEECISGKVPVKLTGKIGTSQEGGGRLLFIGREVFRKKGDHTIFVKVPATYLDRTFEAYQLKMGSRSGAAPDLSVLEKEGEPLSAEAYSKFRSALGKIAWMSQTRLRSSYLHCLTLHTTSGTYIIYEGSAQITSAFSYD